MTQKLTVIYKAPPGDSKVTEAYGHTFYDGKPEEIEVDDATAAKIKANPVFQPGGPPVEKPHEQDAHEGKKK